MNVHSNTHHARCAEDVDHGLHDLPEQPEAVLDGPTVLVSALVGRIAKELLGTGGDA